MEWDEDRQEFVARWGRGGLNKKVEEQWITEVKVGAGEFEFLLLPSSSRALGVGSGWLRASRIRAMFSHASACGSHEAE